MSMRWANESNAPMFLQVKTLRLAILLVLITTTVGKAASDSIVIGGLNGLDPNDHRITYPVLLALSGGGARGLASIGVLRAFEEKGLRVVAVAGTSMGGIIGGLYACGYSPQQLESIIRQTDFSSLFTNEPARSTMFVTQRQERDQHLLSIRFNRLKPQIPSGLTAGQRLTSLLAELTVKATYRANGRFDSLRVPFRTIATDIVSGQMVTLTDGSLAEAMRATMAFPLAFTGLERDGQLLMDGGMVMPVPVAIVKQMCDSVQYVVAVNTTSPLLSKSDLVTPMDIADQVTTIMNTDQLTTQLNLADFVITPASRHFRSSDFNFKDSIIGDGYRAGLIAADSILPILQKQLDQSLVTIAGIEINEGDSIVTDEARRRLLNRTFTRNWLVDELKRLTADLSLFELSASVRPEAEAPSSADAIERKVVLDISAMRAPKASAVHIRFDGNILYTDDTLRLVMKLGDTLLTQATIKAGIDRIVERYHHDGHDLANIRRIDVDLEHSILSIQIDEGIIRRIDVLNNYRTRDWFVRSYFPLKVGQAYSTRRASKGIANIYGTDLFERVSQDLRHVDSGAAVQITVDEKKYSQVRLGWHWDDEYKSEEFIELLDDNLLGMGIEYQLHARYGLDRREYFGELKANRIFATYLTGQMRLLYNRLDRTLFDPDGKIVGERREFCKGGFVRFGQQIARFGTVTGKLSVEDIDYRDANDVRYDRFRLSSFSLESLVEDFDRWPFPERGRRHFLEIQTAAHFLGGDVAFTKFFSSIESYFPLGRDVNYHARISIGLSRSGLPASEQFFMGGMHSFSGYHTDELAGDKLFLLNQELRIRLPLRLFLTGRYDAGEVYVSAAQIKLRNLRHGVGASLALDSPIGPIELGYGSAGRDTHRAYFSAGLAF